MDETYPGYPMMEPRDTTLDDIFDFTAYSGDSLETHGKERSSLGSISQHARKNIQPDRLQLGPDPHAWNPSVAITDDFLGSSSQYHLSDAISNDTSSNPSSTFSSQRDSQLPDNVCILEVHPQPTADHLADHPLGVFSPLPTGLCQYTQPLPVDILPIQAQSTHLANAHGQLDLPADRNHELAIITTDLAEKSVSLNGQTIPRLYNGHPAPLVHFNPTGLRQCSGVILPSTNYHLKFPGSSSELVHHTQDTTFSVSADVGVFNPKKSNPCSHQTNNKTLNTSMLKKKLESNSDFPESTTKQGQKRSRSKGVDSVHGNINIIELDLNARKTYEESHRKQVRKMRRIGACLECRRRKEPCSNTNSLTGMCHNCERRLQAVNLHASGGFKHVFCARPDLSSEYDIIIRELGVKCPVKLDYLRTLTNRILDAGPCELHRTPPNLFRPGKFESFREVLEKSELICLAHGLPSLPVLFVFLPLFEAIYDFNWESETERGFIDPGYTVLFFRLESVLRKVAVDRTLILTQLLEFILFLFSFLGVIKNIEEGSIEDEVRHSLRKIKFAIGYHLTQLGIRAFTAEASTLGCIRGTTEGLLLEDTWSDDLKTDIEQAIDEGKVSVNWVACIKELVDNIPEQNHI